MTKSSYSTIHEGGETQALTQAGNPETGGSRITTKHRVFFALALTAAFLVGHQTITQGSGLRMNMASTAADLVDLNSDLGGCRGKGDDCQFSSDCCNIGLCCGPRPGDGRHVCIEGDRAGKGLCAGICHEDGFEHCSFSHPEECCSGACATYIHLAPNTCVSE